MKDGIKMPHFIIKPRKWGFKAIWLDFCDYKKTCIHCVFIHVCIYDIQNGKLWRFLKKITWKKEMVCSFPIPGSVPDNWLSHRPLTRAARWLSGNCMRVSRRTLMHTPPTFSFSLSEPFTWEPPPSIQQIVAIPPHPSYPQGDAKNKCGPPTWGKGNGVIFWCILLFEQNLLAIICLEEKYKLNYKRGSVQQWSFV